MSEMYPILTHKLRQDSNSYPNKLVPVLCLIFRPFISFKPDALDLHSFLVVCYPSNFRNNFRKAPGSITIIHLRFWCMDIISAISLYMTSLVEAAEMSATETIGAKR